MKIAILGWGSLIWDQRELLTSDNWQKGGPILPIEFSRISSGGRLTLVIDEQNGVPVITQYARSGSANLSEAIEDLRKREGSPSHRIGVASQTINNATTGFETIKSWATNEKWDAVIWTGLPSNFEDKEHVPFTVENGLVYLSGLVGEEKDEARKYIERAPKEVDTPLRRRIGKKFWA